MHRTKRMTVAFAATMAVLSLTAPASQAQICGDSDNSGDITEADGINTLRAAANVASPCTNALCDTNGDGVINDVDSVNVLRAAEGLGTTLECVSAEINEVISEVETGEGDPPAELRVGAAPIPGPGAVDTIGAIEGSTTIVPGSANTIKVPYDASAQSAQAAQALGVDPQELDLKMIIAINDDEQFLQGFFEIPLETLIGEISLTTFFPQGLGDGTFLFCPATQLGGILSNYGVLEQTPAQVAMGDLQVSLSFSPPDVDVDLALSEPAGGEQISFGNFMSVTGGMLDLDSVCSDEIGSENITYPDGSEPLAGQYMGHVTYFSNCATPVPADWTVVINLNGGAANGGTSLTRTGTFSPSQTGPMFTQSIPFTFTPTQP